MNNNEIWQKRKLDHISKSIEYGDGPGMNGLEDVFLIHQALPGLSWNDVNTKACLFGRDVNMPVIINAITGGPPEAGAINSILAEAARESGVGMAVGSQSLAIKHSELEESFRVVRKINPQGLVIANVSAMLPPEVALKAVEMLDADALQLHLNPAQELYMSEGDRDFARIEENIAAVVDLMPVEVIVKEVGCGISFETAQKLAKAGVKWIDVGGRGGTNFIKIESGRNPERSEPPLEWGIPTAYSLLEVKRADKSLKMIASGGIRSALDAVKCFALGADAVAIARPLLKIAVQEGLQAVIKYLKSLEENIKRILLLSGVKTPGDMSKAPVVITGRMKEWIEQRDPTN